MGIQLIIFDFDGTIADTRAAIIAAKQETMSKLGLDVADEEACAATIGLSSKIGFQVLYPSMSDERLEECVTEYHKIFDKKKDLLPPVLFDDVISTLEMLMEKGIVCSIASSRNRASLLEFLEKLNIAEYFPYVLGGEDTVKLKPNPEPVLKTLQELSFIPGEALVIGDMPMDIEMGKNAGVHTCGVTYGNSTREKLLEAGADFVIDRLAELEQYL